MPALLQQKGKEKRFAEACIAIDLEYKTQPKIATDIRSTRRKDRTDFQHCGTYVPVLSHIHGHIYTQNKQYKLIILNYV